MKRFTCLLLLIFGTSTYARSLENEALIAIYHNDDVQLQQLIARNPSLRDWRSEFVGSNLLHYAVVSESPKALSALLHLGFNVNQRNKAGLTALHMAAYFNEGDICLLLVHAGADVLLKNALGQTATQVAVKRGAGACLKSLPN